MESKLLFVEEDTSLSWDIVSFIEAEIAEVSDVAPSRAVESESSWSLRVLLSSL